LRICVTEAAVPTQGSQALLKGCEPTILAAEAGIICTPRIVLRLRARAGSSYHNENCQHEEQNSHGDLLVLRWYFSINIEHPKLFQQRGEKLLYSTVGRK
jgi:hypothetical protein